MFLEKSFILIHSPIILKDDEDLKGRLPITPSSKLFEAVGDGVLLW